MSAGIMTGMRGARCNRGRRRRETPASQGVCSAKPGPKSHLGMRESRGQSRGGTPEGERTLQGARRNASCGGYGLRLTAFRILFLFVSQFVARVSDAIPGSSGEGRKVYGCRAQRDGSRSHRRRYLLQTALSAKGRIANRIFYSLLAIKQNSGARTRRENGSACRIAQSKRSMRRPPHRGSAHVPAGSRGPKGAPGCGAGREKR